VKATDLIGGGITIRDIDMVHCAAIAHIYGPCYFTHIENVHMQGYIPIGSTAILLDHSASLPSWPGANTALLDHVEIESDQNTGQGSFATLLKVKGSDQLDVVNSRFEASNAPSVSCMTIDESNVNFEDCLFVVASPSILGATTASQVSYNHCELREFHAELMSGSLQIANSPLARSFGYRLVSVLGNSESVRIIGNKLRAGPWVSLLNVGAFTIPEIDVSNNAIQGGAATNQLNGMVCYIDNSATVDIAKINNNIIRQVGESGADLIHVTAASGLISGNVIRSCNVGAGRIIYSGGVLREFGNVYSNNTGTFVWNGSDTHEQA
jgi:hypothetical protein